MITATARYTEQLREIARNEIRRYFDCCSDSHLVLFAGNGCTGAMQLFVAMMNRQDWGLESISKYWISQHSEGEVESDKFRSSTNDEERIRRLTQLHTLDSGVMTHNLEKHAKLSRLVVFLFDTALHHSSFLLLKELATDRLMKGGVTSIAFQWIQLKLNRETASIDLECLIENLAYLALLRQKLPLQISSIAILAVASNITGITNPVAKITRICHHYGTPVIWDFAAVSGSSRLSMSTGLFNEETTDQAAEMVDGLIISPHKFLGGPGTSGILIVSRRLFPEMLRPGLPGGGTVDFVTAKEQHYMTLNPELREESGTPNIPACVRAGVVMRLHSQLDIWAIRRRENWIKSVWMKAWTGNPNVHILGPENLKLRKCIISFCISVPQTIQFKPDDESKNAVLVDSPLDKYLHGGYVACLLNDIFGIQSRSGCACAGPYALELLGIDDTLASEYMVAITEGIEILRPSVVRIGGHFSMPDELVEVVRDAVLWIAEKGWRLLPFYRYVIYTGHWSHRFFDNEFTGLNLDIGYGSPNVTSHPTSLNKNCYGEIYGEIDNCYFKETCTSPNRFTKLVFDAEKLIKELERKEPRSVLGRALLRILKTTSGRRWHLNEPRFSHLIWFMTPIEAVLKLGLDTGIKIEEELNRIRPWTVRQYSGIEDKETTRYYLKMSLQDETVEEGLRIIESCEPAVVDGICKLMEWLSKTKKKCKKTSTFRAW